MGDHALTGNPLDDIGVLADPERVIGVWRAGRRVKHTATLLSASN